MNTRTQVVIAVVVGQLVGLLGYVDVLFIPLVLAGPPIVGGVAASRGLRLPPVVALWVGAGLNMTLVDWLFLREDVRFHLALTVVMTLLAVAGHAAVRAVARRRRVPAGPGEARN